MRRIYSTAIFIIFPVLVFAQSSNCKAILPTVIFRGDETKIGLEAKGILAKAAAMIKQAPECNVRVAGYGANSKMSQQRSWDRVNAVITFLVERQGISENRIIFAYGEEGGNSNTADLITTSEEGPTSVPAPHPYLRKKY